MLTFARSGKPLGSGRLNSECSFPWSRGSALGPWKGLTALTQADPVLLPVALQ